MSIFNRKPKKPKIVLTGEKKEIVIPENLLLDFYQKANEINLPTGGGQNKLKINLELFKFWRWMRDSIPEMEEAFSQKDLHFFFRLELEAMFRPKIILEFYRLE